METLSPSKFRRVGAIVFRIVWMAAIVTLAIALLYKPFVKMIFDNGAGFTNEKYSYMVLGGSCFLALLAILNLYKLIILIFGRIHIYKDVLRDKYIHVVRSTDDNGHTTETYYYYLYFDQIFGRYKKRTQVSKKYYEATMIGKEYYIGIVHGSQDMKVFPAEQYQLSSAGERALITDVHELGKKAHWRWQAPEEKPVVNDGGVKRITAEQVAEDAGMYMSTTPDKPSIAARFFKLFSIAVVLVVVPMLFVVFYRLGGIGWAFFGMFLMAFPIVPIVVLTLIVTRVVGSGARNRKKEILAGHYKVILDKVIATEEHDAKSFNYRFIHELMPVRLQSGHTVNLSRAQYNNVRPGDNLYIVYLDSGSPYDDKNIVAVYQEKLGRLDFGFEVTWATS